MTPKVVGQFEKTRQGRKSSTFGAWKADPSVDNYRAVYAEIEPTVNSAMRSYGGDDPTLRTRARIIATKALHSYDPENPSKASLNTHVFHNMQRLQPNTWRERNGKGMMEFRYIEK